MHSIKHLLRTHRHVWIICAVACTCIVGGVWLLGHVHRTPIPAVIKQQAKFTIIYPSHGNIDMHSWQYLQDQGSVSFVVRIDNISATFTEQQIPLAFQDDAAAYDRFVGGLRPFANFTTNLGTVSLVDFVTATDFESAGQAGMLRTHGTLVLAHPNQLLSDTQWRDLFASLVSS